MVGVESVYAGNRSVSKLIKAHQPCHKCGSSDALSLYEDGSYCFSCKTSTIGDEMEISENTPTVDKETCFKYSVTVSDNGQHLYPYFNSWKEHIANKVRGKNKTFSVEGDISQAALFGQQIFKKGGKYITVCEGELDAMCL